MTSEGIAPVNDAIKEAQEFTDLMRKFSLNRVLFVTTKGLLGLGLESIQPGDQIWVVQDARLVFTVRPTTHGDFTLLGETYVYPCMSGELMKYAKGKCMRARGKPPNALNPECAYEADKSELDGQVVYRHEITLEKEENTAVKQAQTVKLEAKAPHAKIYSRPIQHAPQELQGNDDAVIATRPAA
ncbi:hypothetical protein BU25DRAFT_453544 [Macroventuria anomochaeta]|uniref:Uncharacterized protein n=1 Tax=Macroventuria anomochaeta TaxID=301207 RepID=A0ACB6SIE6_9PLEO|nr:uncharacterized protein BU25DRAFT_453544 [Macroventuria anomochaeta]KAF2633829.1 hypothetical protein BU25DRAFT_453544 [Macroventuria anomochaeta]